METKLNNEKQAASGGNLKQKKENNMSTLRDFIENDEEAKKRLLKQMQSGELADLVSWPDSVAKKPESETKTPHVDGDMTGSDCGL